MSQIRRSYTWRQIWHMVREEIAECLMLYVIARIVPPAHKLEFLFLLHGYLYKRVTEIREENRQYEKDSNQATNV